MIVQLDNIKQDMMKQTEIGSKTESLKETRSQMPQRAVYEKDHSLMEAYSEKPISKDQLMESAQNTDLKNTKDYMILMSNSMSQEDYQKLKEEGFSVETMDPEEVVTILDKIKVTLAKSGVEVNGYTDTLNQDTLQEITGSVSLSGQIMDQLQQADVSSNPDLLLEVSKAVEKGMEIKPIQDTSMQYLVENQVEPTIDHLYIAQFTSNTENSRQAKGYYQDSVKGYYSKKAEQPEWQQLQPQIEKALEKEGIPVTEETLEQAKWLVDKGLLLNEKNMTALQEYQSLPIPFSSEQLINQISYALVLGKQPGMANMTTTEHPVDTAIRIHNTIKNLDENTIQQAVQNLQGNQGELTVKALEQAAGEKISSMDKVASTDNFTRAKLQVAEIQMKMTAEANLSLLRQGFQIETAPLSQLIEKLREEIKQTEELLGANQEVVWNTKATVKEIGTLPAQTIGFLQKNDIAFTLSNFEQQGKLLQKSYETAGRAYETMMTQERKDLGDSMEKAFRNVDELLEEMNLEVNDANRKAVRILGYNQMEISQDSIGSIKDACLTFERVVTKLTPKTTLELIRQQKNPLEMNLNELEAYVSKFSFEEDTEKYSKFLYQLEQKKDITKEERQEYLDVYRLFRQIEKSQGAELGVLVQNQEEINLKNLKQVVKNNVGKGMELVVSDLITATLRPRTYQQKVSSEIYDRLSPSMVDGLPADESISLEQLAEQVKNKSLPENQDDHEFSMDQQVQEEQLQDEFNRLQSVKKVSDEVVKTLLSYDMPLHADYLLSAGYFLGQRGETFKNLLKEEKTTQKLQSALEELPKALTDQESAQEAYDNLVEAGKEIIEEQLSQPEVTPEDVKFFAFQYKQLTMAQKFSKEEYYEIPLQIKDELTAIHLKVVHGMEKGVTCTMETAEFGKVRGDFKLEHGQLEGLVVSDKKEGLQQLRSALEGFESNLSQEGIQVKAMNFVDSKQQDFPFFTTDQQLAIQKEDQSSDISTRELYQVAKTFIITIQSL